MDHEGSEHNPWRFEAPIDRGSLRLRTGLGAAGALLLSAAAAEADLKHAWIGTALGALGSIAFALFGYVSWCLAGIPGPPLVLDERGLSFDDGLTGRSFVPWEEVEEVALARRRVMLTLRTDERPCVMLPLICHADAPPEWTAGLIETFRQHALHRA